jgi:hypothetical protein
MGPKEVHTIPMTNRKPSGDKHTIQFKLLLTTAEKAAYRKAAKADGRSLSAWLRWVASRAAGLLLLLTACGGTAEGVGYVNEAPVSEPAAVQAAPVEAPPERVTVVRVWQAPPVPPDAGPDSAPACEPCPQGGHVEGALCVLEGRDIGPAGCVTPSLCASPLPDHTRHGTASDPLCQTEEDGGIWACYLCPSEKGCCDCLNGAHEGRRLDAVYCLTTCCAGTIDQGH